MPLVNAEPNQDVRFHPAPRAAINLGRMPELKNLALLIIESKISADPPRPDFQPSVNLTMQRYVPKESMATS